MGFPANINFEWEAWLDQDLLDGITLRTSWFEGMEYSVGDPVRRGKLPAVLDDEVVADVLRRASARGVPLHLNRYASHGGELRDLDEYLEDIDVIYRDERFAGFDIYEFGAYARWDSKKKGLAPVGDLASRVAALARSRGLV
jgi:hypothetical protein